MPRESIYEITAQDIGPFELTEEFESASRDTLREMRQRLQWKAGYYYTGFFAKMGEVLDDFSEVETKGEKIYASFLGHIALDLTKIVGSEDTMRNLRVFAGVPHIYDPKAMYANFPKRMHADGEFRELDLGAHYVAVNKFPTVIPELGETEAGHIYRMSDVNTQHCQPEFEYSPLEPRVLISLNA